MQIPSPQPLAPLPGIIFERDRAVSMRDGTHLYVNIFRPQSEGRYPVILSVSPYGKDLLPERYMLFTMLGIDVGTIETSDYAAFEAPDPGFWVPNGYVVIHADVRGMFHSEGHAGWLSDQDAQDYYDLIEWAAQQPWSTSAIGLNGVSYLAMSQWPVAALNPPHLKAIIPWESVTDMYREFAYHGGIPETGFLPLFYQRRVISNHNPQYPPAENFLEQARSHPLDDEYWAGKRPHLPTIRVPALVCASWSDQGLHTRGSFEGFRHIASEHKWLYTHGRRKWEVYYSSEAREAQKQFFDFFLKGIENGMLSVPHVRLEVRKAYYEQEIRSEQEWPLSETRYQTLYLDGRTGSLVEQPIDATASVAYTSVRTGQGDDRAVFVHTFRAETELTGYMNLKLWVAAEDANDLDLFVAIKKIDASGKEVGFSGYNCIPNDVAAKGWLRISHRELDVERSSEGQPYHRHRQMQKVSPGEIVPVEIEIWPSSTLFEAGSSLQLIVQGYDQLDYPAFAHGDLVNHGQHRIFTGGPHASALVIPVIASRNEASS